MTEEQFPPARFYGVRTYVDPLNRFSFRYPTNWHEFALEDGREGVMFSPEAENPTTWFSVWTQQLPESIIAEDLDDLREGVDEGLASLPECDVEHAMDQTLENLIKFERIYTFREGEATRKRKVWLLYVDKWLIVATWQGASVAAYKHYAGMGGYSFTTFTIPQELWFAVDRNLTGAQNAQ